MEKAYVFKVALMYRKGLWRRIEIKGGQTLGDFDHIIRDAFNNDTFDHLSEFFRVEDDGHREDLAKLILMEGAVVLRRELTNLGYLKAINWGISMTSV